MQFELKVNGQTRSVDVDPDTPLLWVIRDNLKLTGTKFGCGIAQCGACTVHVNGQPMRSCAFPISALGDQEVKTIESLENHPLQQAWIASDVPQCGYCQSGMIMTAAALLESNPEPSQQDVNEAMSNICRCGTYNRVRSAILTATRKTRAA